MKKPVIPKTIVMNKSVSFVLNHIKDKSAQIFLNALLVVINLTHNKIVQTKIKIDVINATKSVIVVNNVDILF